MKPQDKLCFYKFLIIKMSEHSDLGKNIISFYKAKWVLSRFNIPKDLRPTLINELQDVGLLIRTKEKDLKKRGTSLFYKILS